VELAHLDPERRSGSDAGRPLLDGSFEIIGMKNLREAVTAMTCSASKPVYSRNRALQ